MWGCLVHLMLHHTVMLDSCALILWNINTRIQHYNVWLVNYIANIMLECHYNFLMNFQNFPFKIIK